MRRAVRFFQLLITLACVIALIAAFCALPSHLAFKGGETYTFYVGDTSKNCKVVSTNYSKAGALRLKLRDVCGESAYYSSLDLEEFLQSVNGEIAFIEELADSVNYYCRADLPYSVELYGQQINLHVCVKEQGVMVGSPIIFGGY